MCVCVCVCGDGGGGLCVCVWEVGVGLVQKSGRDWIYWTNPKIWPNNCNKYR